MARGHAIGQCSLKWKLLHLIEINLRSLGHTVRGVSRPPSPFLCQQCPPRHLFPSSSRRGSEQFLQKDFHMRVTPSRIRLGFGTSYTPPACLIHPALTGLMLLFIYLRGSTS